MSASYFGYTVSNTNGNSRQRSAVRVYNDKGEMIAEQFINKHNPLGYVREKVSSKHIDELYTQCSASGMSKDDFNVIFHANK